MTSVEAVDPAPRLPARRVHPSARGQSKGPRSWQFHPGGAGAAHEPSQKLASFINQQHPNQSSLTPSPLFRSPTHTYPHTGKA